MAGATSMHIGGDHAARFENKAATRETPLVKWTILALALGFFAIFLLLPLVAVFVEAFRKGWETYVTALIDPDAWSAIKLTLLAAVISVPLNLVFGVAAAEEEQRLGYLLPGSFLHGALLQKASVRRYAGSSAHHDERDARRRQAELPLSLLKKGVDRLSSGDLVKVV